MNSNLYKRRVTRAVFVGHIGVGGNNPIRIQSMTTADTKDTEATVREIAELVIAGCEIVRLTVPTQLDCENLPNIRREMQARGLKVPLVADIHFTPSIALKVVDYVEKVRINPGNFADKKLFKTFEITDDDYRTELSRIEEKFAPLILKCKERGVAMRIGTNHGSLSDRIMNRYGDTPEGMVESAMEFLRIAAKNGYHDIILSMKSSNPQVMVTAYRLLVKRMSTEGMNYPLHLGVTEAGEGEDARIKSAVGIGTLLEEGIGDTVRVSLTEDSIHEIPVVGALIAPYNQKFYFNGFHKTPDPVPEHLKFICGENFPLTYARRPSLKCTLNGLSFGGSDTVRVWTALGKHAPKDIIAVATPEMRFEGVELTPDQYTPETVSALESASLATALISGNADTLCEASAVTKNVFIIRTRDAFSRLETLVKNSRDKKRHLEICVDTAFREFYSNVFSSMIAHVAELMKRLDFKNFSFSLFAAGDTGLSYRILARALENADLDQPLHIRYRANERPLLLDAATQVGSLLIDGLGDAIQIDGATALSEKLTLSYGILQAARVRISKTEFIACPSCGRTQFNLQEVTALIKSRTAHLKGLKIAIMGCIVNGPGEMADADFGYVGTGTGKISLYVGKECVERNIPEAHALERLVGLVKEHDKWVDKI